MQTGTGLLSGPVLPGQDQYNIYLYYFAHHVMWLNQLAQFVFQCFGGTRSAMWLARTRPARLPETVCFQGRAVW